MTQRRGARRLAVPFAALVTGVTGGLVSVGFLHAIELSRWAFERMGVWPGPLSVLAVLLLPALGALAAGVLSPRLASTTAVHGAQDCRDVWEREGSARVTPARKLLACAFTVLCGGSAGCEGVVGQAGSAVGRWVGGKLGTQGYPTQVIAACGLSAAFGGLLQAPIAGCILAAEIVLGGYAVRNLPSLGLSAFSAALLSRHLGGGRSALLIPEFEIVSPAELAAHGCLGVAAGALALLFLRALARTSRVHDRLAISPWLKPAIGGIAVAGIGLLWPHTRGVGYATISSLVAEPLLPGTIAALLLAKIAATSMTLGSGGTGGMLAPSMFVGASLGSLLGAGIHRFWPQAASANHSYAMTGMVALLAGVTRAPLTAIVLAAELSGNAMSLLPATVAVVASVFVASAGSEESPPLLLIGRQARGAPARSGRLQSRRVSELMRRTSDTVQSDAPIAEVLSLLKHCRDDILVVVDPEHRGRVVGVVSLDHVKAWMGNEQAATGTAFDVMTTPSSLREGEPLTAALSAMTRSTVAALPVTAADGGLLGVVTRNDVMEVCAAELLEGLPGAGEGVAPLSEPGTVEATPQLHEVCAVPVPKAFVGRCLRDIDLLRRFGVACVGMRRASEHGELTAMPLDTRRPLQAGSVMILIGDRVNIDRVRHLDRGDDRRTGGA